MNALIPALLVVLLSEVGGQLGTLALRQPNIVAFAITGLVAAAVGAGWQLSGAMVPDARMLMLGVLVLFAAYGQLLRTGRAGENLWGVLLAVSRSPTPGVAFGFAACSGQPVASAIGALFAVGIACALGAAGLTIPLLVRRIAGGILLVIGLFLPLRAFSLI